MQELIKNISKEQIIFNNNMIVVLGEDAKIDEYQLQTKDSFSEKWAEVSKVENLNKIYEAQFAWFLKLYGFEDEIKLAEYLKVKKIILDTGCGLGYKASWFATMSPESIVIGIDISDSIEIAVKNYKHLKNLFFIKGDIANTPFKENSIDFVVCDQVIMHTENPDKTFNHLSQITKSNCEFACYVYSKKALPRELVDDYFRVQTHKINNKAMWDFSEQLTELGKRLTELQVCFDCPEIPLLGIKAGRYDLQRFFYWNFLKCYWNEELGFEISKATNFDWYSPSNAKRFTKEEFLDLAKVNNLLISYFHEEEACYSGRFIKYNDKG